MKKLLTAATVAVTLVVVPATGVAGAAESNSSQPAAVAGVRLRRAAHAAEVAAKTIGISAPRWSTRCGAGSPSPTSPGTTASIPGRSSTRSWPPGPRRSTRP